MSHNSFRTRNIYTKLVEKIKIRFMFHNVFYRKSCLLRDNVEKYCTAGKATDNNMVHAHCMLDNEVYKHKLRIYNTYSMSISTTTARTRRSVTLYLHCLSCFVLNLTTIQNLKVSANIMFCNILPANNISYLILSIFTIYPQTRFYIPR